MKKKILNSSIKLIKKYKSYNEEELEIIVYGLESIYLIITKAIIIFALAYVLGILKEILILLLTYNIIRSQAFGIHASRSIYCLISSIIMFIGGTYLCLYITLPLKIIMIISLVCNLLILMYAPADTHKRPLINKRKRIKFKYRSIIISILYTIIIFTIKDNIITNFLLIGMIEATIMILPITYKLFKLPYNNYKHYNYNV